MWTDDEVVWPRESAWFGQLDANGTLVYL